MTDRTPRPRPSNASSIWSALKFRLTDHLLIRACEAEEAGHKEKLRGLVPPPPEGKLYGPSILVTWARKLVERRYKTPFHVGSLGGRTLTDHLFSVGLRLIGFLGSWGVPGACAIVGLVSGLAFLPLRIFNSTEVTLTQILIPLFLGSVFVLWQVVNLALYLARVSGRSAAEDRESPGDVAGPKMLLVARRTLPPYVRWNANLGWCVFWIVVLVLTVLEYGKHSILDRDYVYHPQYMPLEERLSWLHKLSAILPKSYHLPDESMVWADIHYRKDGYRLTSGAPSPLSLHSEIPFLRGDDRVVLAYKPEAGQAVMGVIFTESGQVLDQSPPFELQATVKQIFDSSVTAIAVESKGSLGQLAIQIKGEGLSFHKEGSRGKPLTFLADGVVAVSNSPEFVVSFDALPRKIEVREEGAAEGESTTVSLKRDEGNVLLARLTEPSGYARHWFFFLFGVILTFGLAPRVVALPIFGVLYMVCKWRLYQEFSKNPFASIIAELNQRPKASVEIEEGRYHDRPLAPNTPAPVEKMLPHKDVLAVSYGVNATPDDVRRLGRVSDFELYERPAGDANTNAQVTEWLGRHVSFGRYLVCTKLAATPDRPFVRFMQEVASRGYACELAFLDLPEDPKAYGDRLTVRIGVWRDVMERANLLELLPADLRKHEKKGAPDGD